MKIKTDIIYLNDQADCPLYKANVESKLRILRRSKGQKDNKIEIVYSSILFVIEGEMLLTYNDVFEKKLSSEQFIFMPQGTRLMLTALTDLKLMVSYFDVQLMHCEFFRLDMLEPYIDKDRSNFFPLSSNEFIQMYVALLEKYVDSDFYCACLSKSKHQEFFFLLRAFYNQQELATFFAPALGEDMFFINTVLRHYSDVKNVKELAYKMNYSLSGFRKKFKKSFGQSAFVWLQYKRSSSILHDLKENILSNKELVDKYDFSSDSRFYEFCKHQYDKTPGQIRKGK